MPSYQTGLYLPMASAQKLTKTLLVLGAGLYLAYDIFAYRNAKNDSISAVCVAEMYGHPAYALMLGALMGHLTWPSLHARDPQACLKIVVPAIVGLAAWDHYMPVQHPVWPVWPFMSGIPLGHATFAQSAATLYALQNTAS